MKHYKIISFRKTVDNNNRHLYTIRRINGQETGEYVCATLNNDTKIESDFCCEQNCHIDSIRCTNDNRVYELGQNTPIGIIEKIQLKNGRGVVKVNNSEELHQINSDILRLQRNPIVNNLNSEKNMATAKKVSSAKSAVANKTASVSASRSQIKKENPFTELEAKILKEVPDIRLEKFLKVNLPKTVKEFLVNFFTKYNAERNTIYVSNKSIQTTSGRRRSLGDIFKICKYYYPNVTLNEVVELLFKELGESLRGGFRFSYCSTVKKRVFYYSAGSGNFREDVVVDEYGHRLPWYMDKI